MNLAKLIFAPMKLENKILSKHRNDRFIRHNDSLYNKKWPPGAGSHFPGQQIRSYRFASYYV